MKNGINKKDKVESSKVSMRDLAVKVQRLELAVESTNDLLEVIATEVQDCNANIRALVNLFTAGLDKN